MVLLTVLIIIMFKHLKRKSGMLSDKSPMTVKEKSEITHDIIFYIFAYLPPLLIDDFTVASNSLTFIVLIATIFILYYKKNMLHINPIIIFKYKTYRVTDSHGNTTVLISNLTVKLDKVTYYQKLTSDLNVVIDDELFTK